MNQARKISSLPLADAGDYLGPGRVTQVAPGELTVELRDGRSTPATMALAYPYAPQVGDVLLVIGKGEEHYVIGVIHGTGQATLAFQGAVDLRAEGGPLTLSSDQGVTLRGPSVEVETPRLQVFAESIVERCTSLFTRVFGALDLRAGDVRTVVEGDSFTTAKNASIVTEEAMTINGDEIHLG